MNQTQYKLEVERLVNQIVLENLLFDIAKENEQATQEDLTNVLARQRQRGFRI